MFGIAFACVFVFLSLYLLAALLQKLQGNPLEGSAVVKGTSYSVEFD